MSGSKISRNEQRLNEFCHAGKLESYRAVLRQLFEDIEAAGCNVCSRYERETSSHEFNTKGCLIRVCLKEIYEEPVQIIWSILHEFGHHLSGRQNGVGETIERETLAWRLARQLVFKYPALEGQIEGFDRYSKQCIQTYIDGLKTESDKHEPNA